MDHSNHIPLQAVELNQENLEGATIYGPEDETVGSVSHVHGDGADATVVLDVGGFLGIGAKTVALPMASFEFMRDEGGTVHAVTSMTKDQAKALPEHVD